MRFEIPQNNIMGWFNKDYPNLTISMTTANWGDTMNRVATELSAGTGAYEFCHVDWIAIQAMIEAGWLSPLDDYIDRDIPNYTSEFPENVRAVYRGTDGLTYAFPFDSNCMLTYYRKDIFEEVGIKVPDDISTWDKALEASKTLFESGYMSGFCAKRPVWSSDWWLTHINAHGAHVYNKDFTPGLMLDDNTPTDEAQAAMDMSLAFFEYATPEVVNWEDGDLAEAEKAGRVVFAPCTWGGAAVTDPEFNPYADVFGIARVPIGPGKVTHHIEKAGYGGRMGGAGYLIPKVAKHQDESWNFINYLPSKCMEAYPDEKTDAYLAGGAQPGRINCMGDNNWWKTYPLLEGLSKNLPDSVYKVWQIPEFNELAALIGSEAHELYAKRKTVVQALKAMNDGIYEIFKRAGRYD